MTRKKALHSFCVGLALASLASPAAASTTFPEALRKQLGLQQIAGPPPGCQLCHKDDAGGLKTATKPLGRSLLQAGVMGGSVPSLLAGLDTLESDATDSDHDGIGDIAELRAVTNPNVADVGAGGGGAGGTAAMPCVVVPEIPLPETGCSLVGAAVPNGAWLALVGCASFALLRRRR